MSVASTDRAGAHAAPAARNTHVAAEIDAPAITVRLASFVATHRSRGWTDAVEHEAHRTFYNWLGCAIGASRALRASNVPMMFSFPACSVAASQSVKISNCITSRHAA